MALSSCQKSLLLHIKNNGIIFARPWHLWSLCSVFINFSASNINFIITSYLIFCQCYSLKADLVRSSVLPYISYFCTSWLKYGREVLCMFQIHMYLPVFSLDWLCIFSCDYLCNDSSLLLPDKSLITVQKRRVSDGLSCLHMNCAHSWLWKTRLILSRKQSCLWQYDT